MAQLKDLIVSGVTRCIGKLYATELVGKLTGTADRAIADNNGSTIDSTYIKDLSYSNLSLTLTYGDNNTKSIDVKGTEYSLATDSTLGLVKLYSSTGANVDGTMTQDAITNAINAVYVSPTFTGTPTAPTVDTSDNSTKIATTAYVKAAVQAAIEEMIDTGGYVATAGTPDGESLVTATEFEPITINMKVPTE